MTSPGSAAAPEVTAAGAAAGAAAPATHQADLPASPSAPAPGRAFYLASSSGPMLALYDEPPAPGDHGVLIVPPFGWEEMCSYRARRDWAAQLAAAGYPTLRIDLPGSGDSAGGPREPDRLAAWREAATAAAEWLRGQGCQRVTAIGIGLGGTIAYLATAEGAPIDDLVLWGVHAKGRTLVRELRAHGSVIAARYADEAPEGVPAPAADGIEVVGFLLSAETADSLARLELTERPLPGAGRRVLLVSRDRLPVDARLRRHLEAGGGEVSVIESDDYGAMMENPQQSRSPRSTIARCLTWLAAGPAPAPGTQPPRGPLGSDAAEIGSVREQVLELEVMGQKLFGILSEPVGERCELTAVVLNSGSLRHIGPNRNWVELCRRWAARGVATARIDMRAIGESPGDASPYVRDAGFYVPELVQETQQVVGELAARGLPERFVLVGLCSGAYWSAHTALADPRVAGAFMINLFPFFWSDGAGSAFETHRVLTALRGEAWRRLRHGDVKPAQVREALASLHPRRLRGRARHPDERESAERIIAALDQLRNQGTQALLLLGRDEPLYAQFVRQGQINQLSRWPNLRLERLPSGDHLLRALWVQQLVHQHLDQALERVLESLP